MKTGWVIRKVMCGIRVYARVTEDKAIMAWVSDITLATWLDTKEEAEQLQATLQPDSTHAVELHNLTERPDNAWK